MSRRYPLTHLWLVPEGASGVEGKVQGYVLCWKHLSADERKRAFQLASGPQDVSHLSCPDCEQS